VFLVGAGPGDPRLLTLRGAEVLRRADVVVHDRLVSPAVLDLAPARAERIDVGKAPGRPHPDQAAISELLVERARRGEVVVRLKGGDPFVFGRGGEELLACARAGIPVEVVPGVTAAVAAPAAAGIPLTHRGLARSFAVVTATTADGTPPDWAALARAADTLVVLMGAARLAEVCRALVSAGRSPGEPAGVVEAATTPRQRTLLGTLGTLPGLARAARLRPPATLVVGGVVGLAEELAALQAAQAPSSASSSPSEPIVGPSHGSSSGR
jgi:uroporphyrin-III C-methyltransferase